MSIIYFREMMQMKWNNCAMWFLFVSGIAIVTCYPTGKPEQIQVRDMKDDKQFSSGAVFGKPELSQEPMLKDEKQFPNGTIVGKYTYLDKEGNPIQVKYYADEASYGVELKSIKVLGPNTKRVDQPAPTYEALTAQVSNIKSLPSEPFNTVYPPLPKLKTSDPFEYLGKEGSKINRYKADKASSDFEVYYQNELKGPKQCGKEKVRVYLDKERKIRNALDNFDADKYCEQF